MTPRLLRAAAVRVLLFTVVWWALTEGSTTGWYLGVVAVLAGAATSLHLQPPGGSAPRATALPSFMAWFVWHSALGGIDVARRALRGSVDVRPGIVDVPVTLPAGLPLVTLADVASLLPGTLAVEVRNDHLRVHVLDTRLPVAQQVADLEQRLFRLYGLPPGAGHEQQS